MTSRFRALRFGSSRRRRSVLAFGSFCIILSIDMTPPGTQTGAVARPDAAVALTKAVLRAGAILGLAKKDLGRILGVSPSSVSRLPERHIDPQSKEGELAILVLRAFRSLDALLGGDGTKCRSWLHAPNTHLGGVPAALVQTISGLKDVVEYLDAMRGKV